MALRSCVHFRWTVALNRAVAGCSNYSSAAFRTSESVTNHGPQHEGLFYTVPPDVKNQLFLHGGIPKAYEKQVKTFAEAAFMIRKPALEVMKYLQAADYSRPPVRYVLYGELGCGKSLTMAHIIHYGLDSGFLLVHIPWVPNWMKASKEVANAVFKEKGFVDLPMDAAAWLIHFKNQNQTLLQQPDLTVSQEYTWSKREVTLPGAPLLELVDLGINRVKYASTIIVTLCKEIKTLCTQGRCKALVVIDGFNSFFYQKTHVKNEDRAIVPPSRITLTEGFMELTKTDWCNGAVVLSVDRWALSKDRWASDLPVYQLGKEGFEHLDPFVPIRVPQYNDKEFHSCINYYIDRRWLQSEMSMTEEGRQELLYLSNCNGYTLMNVCAPL